MRITTQPAPLPATEDQPLTRGSKGEQVKAAQNQLLRAGFSLPRYGSDGHFGKETAAALTRFQSANNLPTTGTLTAETLHALENAKSPSPDYTALFADGLLHAVLAIGYDEAGNHHLEQSKLLTGLHDRGYTEVTDLQRGMLALDPKGRYLSKQLPNGHTVIMELITADVDHAKARFANALRNNELVLYGGHGRYGSGPDFDSITSPAGNFVIGQPFEPGHVTLGRNDLTAAPLTPAYQLMFFEGCNTFHYFDDLRAKTPGKSTKTLDVIGSTTELYWHVTAANLLALLDGVTSNHDLEHLETALDAVNRAGPADQLRYFRSDGFEDN